MDSLKFAFDTLIVGALALPWLWLFMRVFFQRGSSKQDLEFPLIGVLSEPTRQTVAGVLILALGYVLGSAVSRISSDLFDDDEILHGIPTQTSIRQGVYLHEYCDEHSVLVATKLPEALAELPGGKAKFCEEGKEEKEDNDALKQEKRDTLNQLVAEFFSLQEGRLLLEGEEKLGRLREFHDQIEILRGASLNGAILFTLSLFGLCALYRARLPAGKLRILRKCASYAPAVACLLLGLWEMNQHFSRLLELPPTPNVSAPTSNVSAPTPNVSAPTSDVSAPTSSVSAPTSNVSAPTSNISAPTPNPSVPTPNVSAPTPNPYERHRDPPLAEAVLILLGIGGLCLRLTDDNPRLFRNVCLTAAVLTLIAYGSWWWTEVLYDQQVIHSFPTNIQSSR